jgi:tetratricopeptide (TPR) repeat protein
MAQQQKTLAQTPEEMRQAIDSLRSVGDRKRLEQELARKNFDTERQKSFEAISGVQRRLRLAQLPTARRLEAETRIDHLITLFNLKDFLTVLKEAAKVTEMLQKLYRHRPMLLPPRGRVTSGAESATTLFHKGLALERAGNIRGAVEAYGRVLERNPQHFQAIQRLQRITARGCRAAK